MADQVQSAETPRPVAAPPRAAAGGSPFRVLKPGQGIHVRWATAVGAGLLALGGTYYLWDKLRLIEFIEANYAARTLIPVAFLLGLAYVIFWLVGRHPGVVDFLIATEGEMKKVNWSTRKEVWGATKVVIVTVLALALVLFVVDLLFIIFFSRIGVLRIDVMHLLGFGNS